MALWAATPDSHAEHSTHALMPHNPEGRGAEGTAHEFDSCALDESSPFDDGTPQLSSPHVAKAATRRTLVFMSYASMGGAARSRDRTRLRAWASDSATLH